MLPQKQGETMNRRQAISSLLTLPFAPFLGAFDHRSKHTSPSILVACIGVSGGRVYEDLIHDTSGLLQPTIIDTEAEMKSVVESVRDQRVMLVAQLDAQFNNQLVWKVLRITKKQPNCCQNFLAYLVYPYLTFSEMTRQIPPDPTPRWAYSEVQYVRVVNGVSSDKDNVQSRWELRYFNNDLAKVEKQVANDVAKVQIQGNRR